MAATIGPTLIPTLSVMGGIRAAIVVDNGLRCQPRCRRRCHGRHVSVRAGRSVPGQGGEHDFRVDVAQHVVAESDCSAPGFWASTTTSAVATSSLYSSPLLGLQVQGDALLPRSGGGRRHR